MSFGWIDDGAWRYAFRRTPVPGLDAFGRAGNFAAHIVVGPRHELPAERLLASYTSPSWWAGAPVGDTQRDSPTLAIGDFLPGPPVTSDPDLAVAVLAWLIRLPGRLVLAMDPDVIVGAMTRASQTLPEVAELGAFSTYETPDSIVRADISGGSRGADTGSVLAVGRLREALAVCRAAIDGDDVTRREIRKAWQRTRTRPDHPSRFLRTGGVLAVAAAGEDSPLDLLLDLASDPATADALLGYEHIRRRLAIDLLGAEPRVAATLGRLRHGLASDRWRQLAVDVAELIDWDASDLANQLRHLAAVNPLLSDAAVDHATELVQKDPSYCAQWPTSLVVDLISSQGRRPLGRAAWEGLARRAAANASDFLALPIDLPWRARVLADAVRVGFVSDVAAGQQLAAVPALIEDFFASSTHEAAVGVLGALPPVTQAELLALVRTHPCPAGVLELVMPIAEHLDPPTLMYLLRRLRDLPGITSEASWASVVGDALDAWAGYAIEHTAIGHDLARMAQLCHGCRHGNVPAWRDLVHALRAAHPSTAMVAKALEVLPEPRLVPTRFALDVCVGAVTTRRDFAGLIANVPQLGSLATGDTLDTGLAAAERAAATAGRIEPAAYMLDYVASLVDERRVPQRRFGGALADQGTQEAAIALVHTLGRSPERAVTVVEQVEHRAGDRGRSWLRSLPTANIRNAARPASGSDIVPAGQRRSRRP